MMIILQSCLVFIIFYAANSLPYEHCEKFPIHFDLIDCTYAEIRREINYIPIYCPNWGTWECSEFKCWGAHPNGYCMWGEISHNDCCTLPEIHYFDMWFKPMNGGYPDWMVEFYNFKIKGYGNDIHIDNGGYYEFEDVFYGLDNNITFLSIIFNYNESCITDLMFFIDGVYAFNVSGEEMDIYIDFYFFTIIKGMMELQGIGCDEKWFFTSAHTLIPTPQRIMELFLMGPQRPADTEICVYMELDELDECHEQVQAQMQQIYILAENLTECDNATKILYDYLMQCQSAYTTWMIVAIVLGALLVVMTLILLIWVIYRLLRRSDTFVIETNKKDIGENVFL